MDGYTSDTTAFADDDDDFSVPLHVNTRTPLRTDSISPQAPDRYCIFLLNKIFNVIFGFLLRLTIIFFFWRRTSSRKFMYEKMTMREWSTSSTPTSTQAPGLLSLAEPNNNDTIVRNLICL